ncbi:hypothetical protein E4U14_006456 [Claviceps sp. LM454 group G7]|nr:hypothetical protein E4U14_006456 [Claviceps sp. LM454 group G7]
MRPTEILKYPFKGIKWQNDSIYKNQPLARKITEGAFDRYYDKNIGMMKDLGVETAVIAGPLHNDPSNPDGKGVHWTATLLNWLGQFVTKKHIYPSKAELEKVRELSKIYAAKESKRKKDKKDEKDRKDKQDKKDKEKKDKEKKEKEKKEKEKKEKEKKEKEKKEKEKKEKEKRDKERKDKEKKDKEKKDKKDKKRRDSAT